MKLTNITLIKSNLFNDEKLKPIYVFVNISVNMCINQYIGVLT